MFKKRLLQPLNIYSLSHPITINRYEINISINDDDNKELAMVLYQCAYEQGLCDTICLVTLLWPLKREIPRPILRKRECKISYFVMCLNYKILPNLLSADGYCKITGAA